MENPTLILTVDLNTAKEKFIAILDGVQEIANKLEDKVKIETEKQITFINEFIIDANNERRYMICMFFKYPNGITIPYGYPTFASNDTDAIIKYVRGCFELMTYDGMPVAYENIFYTENKLLCLAVGAMCDIQMLERALAEAEANVLKH